MTAAEFRAARKSLSLTQAQMAERIGLSRSQVIRIEKGESPIREGYVRLLRHMLLSAE